MKVLILMGLPSSGKTTFAKELESSNNKLIRHIDFDDLLKRYKKEAVNWLAYLSVQFGKWGTNTFIIDGLIHTNEQLTLVINEVVKNKELTEIELHYWEENRVQCLINDINRRDISSAFSIKRLTLDVPNLDELKLLFENTTMKLHKVAVKPDWLVFSDKYNLGCTINQPYLKSDSWSTGGSSGNCWNDEITYYDGDEPLANFEQFDNLITSIDPTISFLTYKKLYAISCSMGEIHEDDYYGGSGSHYTYYQCNIEVLYNELVALGIL
jgi:dephospho-CoA kinase